MSSPADVTVILLRHGTSPLGGAARDRDRPLDPDATERLHRGAARLARYGPVVALVSAARRTSETADAVLAHVETARRDDLETLYNADAATVREAVEDAVAGGAARVLLIGHNPGITAAAHELSADGSVDALRPGDAVVCRRIDGSWGFVERIAVQGA